MAAPKKPRRNAAQKRALKSAEVHHFLKKYARKADNGMGNDRQYDRNLEGRVKRMRPETLDRLLREEEE